MPGAALTSALVDGQQTLFQLQDGEIDRRDVDRSDHGVLPGTIRALFAQNVFVNCRSKGLPVIDALTIYDLRVVEGGVMPVSEGWSSGASAGQILFAVFQHVENGFAVVISRSVERV